MPEESIGVELKAHSGHLHCEPPSTVKPIWTLSELSCQLHLYPITLDKIRIQFQITKFAGHDYNLSGTRHWEGDIHINQISSICAHSFIHLLDIWTRSIIILLYLQKK